MKENFIVCYETSNKKIYLQYFIIGPNIIDSIERSLKLNYYNKSAKLYSNNNKSSWKLRVQNFKVSIEYIRTNLIMIAYPPIKKHVAQIKVIYFDDMIA